MKYAIEYEHLKDELVTNDLTDWHFKKVKDTANELRLELSDEEFNQFFKLHKADKDIIWLMHQMSAYNLSFTEALVSYIIC
jgi:regulation of enolase protein 1 (concanavalin A-like superfamily)